MALASFRLYLFGSLALFQGERSLPLPASVTARSLLAYLVLLRERPHPRPVLAGAFWPESSEAHARRALTQALWQIRRVLPGLVQSDAESVSLSTGACLWVDVAAFQDLLGPHQPAHQQESAPREGSIRQICQAIELYRGDLLEGFYDDWVLVERERLREMYLQALGKLLHLEKSVGRYHDALGTALRLARADPWQEAAHRELMRLYFALHQPEAAIKQFEACCKALKDELGLEPETETVALANEIAAKLPQDLRPYLPHIPAPATSLGDSLFQAPLVGRETERSELTLQVEAALGGSGGVALVEGEAGVGKTCLLQKAARDAEWRGAQVVWGHCREREGLPPYAPWVEALQSGLSPMRVSQLAQCTDRIWLQVLRPLLPALAEHLPDLPLAPPIEPAQERQRLVNAFHQLLAAWGRIAPLVIVLEDLHWADADSLDVLISITPRLQHNSVLILGAFRGEDARSHPTVWEKLQALDRAGFHYHLELGRLDANNTADLIRHSLRLAEAAPLFASRLYQETGGNPLFVLETLRALCEEGALFQDELGRWHTSWDDTTADYAELPLPPAVERVIARRLERLTPAERAILDAAAVLGSSFDFDLLRETGQLDPQAALPTVGALVRRHFMEETPTAYHFGHDKIRQVIYQSLAPEARRRLHRQAGQALERLRPDQLSGLAHHFYQAEAREKACAYSHKAGRQAQAAFAHAEAVAHFSRALELLPELDRANRYTLLLAREKIYDLQGERQAQQQDLAALKKLAETLNDGQKAEIALRQAKYAEATNDYPATIATAQTVIELARNSQAIGLEAVGYLQWGVGLRYKGDYVAARSQVEQALGLARDAQLFYEEAESLYQLGIVFAHQGECAQASACFEQALRIYQQIGHRRGQADTLRYLGFVCDSQADYVGARAWYEQAMSICLEIGDRRGEGHVLNNLAIIWQSLGSAAEAKACLERALAAFQQVGDRLGESQTLANIGCVVEAQGDYDAARVCYEQSLSIYREIGYLRGECMSLINLCLLFHYLGENGAARDYGKQALPITQEMGERYLQGYALTYLGHALTGLRQWDDAANVYQQAMLIRRELGEANLAIESLAGLARVSLERGDLAQAQAQADEILCYMACNSLDGADEPVRVYLTCYRVLSASQDPRAVEVLTGAHNLLQARAANISDERARRSFLENVAAHREIMAAYQQMQTRQHGRQIAVRLPRAGAPSNRPLRDDEWVEVMWTVQSPQDDDIPSKAARRQRRLLRLARQAQAQNAAPTIDVLAEALEASRATIKRDLAALRAAGHRVNLRGERRQA